MKKKRKCRVEMYPEDRKKVKIMAAKAEKNIADFLNELVEDVEEKKNDKKKSQWDFRI